MPLTRRRYARRRPQNHETPKAPRILVVDDEVDTCRNLSDILTDLGYRVDTAHDGLTALELVRRQRLRRGPARLEDARHGRPDPVPRDQEAACRHGGASSSRPMPTAAPRTRPSAGAWQVLPKPVDFRSCLQLVDEAVGQPLVMVVDDDPDLCANLWDLLRERGYRVCLAHDERQARESPQGQLLSRSC